jgi:hypothetical protein
LCEWGQAFLPQRAARAARHGRTGAQKRSQKCVLNQVEGKYVSPTGCDTFSPIMSKRTAKILNEGKRADRTIAQNRGRCRVHPLIKGSLGVALDKGLHSWRIRRIARGKAAAIRNPRADPAHRGAGVRAASSHAANGRGRSAVHGGPNRHACAAPARRRVRIEHLNQLTWRDGPHRPAARLDQLGRLQSLRPRRLAPRAARNGSNCVHKKKGKKAQSASARPTP